MAGAATLSLIFVSMEILVTISLSEHGDYEKPQSPFLLSFYQSTADV
jgi:hypothetical protein